MAVAEDCLQDAIAQAVAQWGPRGLPDNPQAWLYTVAKRRVLDGMRRTATHARYLMDHKTLSEGPVDDLEIADDRLRLMFTCCHPALEPDAQIALMLRVVGGLSTTEIARAFLVKPATMGQRISRAKSKIRLAGIAFKLPETEDMPDRLSAVLTCIYLIYNEGYAAQAGKRQIRIDLCEEALFLADMIVGLAPQAAEAQGLLALIRFSHARRIARLQGDYIPLAEQNRELWDQALIDQAAIGLEAALRLGQIGPYQLQAAIHGLHCQAKTAEDTDWAQISALYALLRQMTQSKVVAINHAVALCFAGEAKQAMLILQSIAGEMREYQPFFAAMAEVYVRLGIKDDAVAAYEKAIALSEVKAVQDFLLGRMLALE